MQIYNGKSVFGGIAIGKISVYQKKEQQVKRVKIDDPEQEMARYEKAKAEGIKQLQGLYDKASHSLAFCMKKHAKRLARPMQRSSRYIR